ncbi:LytR C-terminal domain-containing protein [Geodermatophilus sp. YIM 151500]|uniref:LytR C-terminal domain-containing protein n=1 Tax=Geodermatophilus sp. YIM 151500 TaxID=2984531 RepID=UPI0021E4FC9D|nr:LytR C-terminal domain-containing protein [Geodermatophilus sp. YIM 151500]MCV2488085.1 LytR C-terminal domain-containing protein [Geodermatophilus sp. YIM 151500]
MTQMRTERPPVRARSGRRPIPPLIFLLVLALAAAGVWWNVLRQDEARATRDEAAACSEAPAPPPALDPASVSVRVLNATDVAGRAGEVAGQLEQRGFVIVEVANDSSDREVTGSGEIRHGRPGTDAALFMTAYVPGATTYEDTRADAVVDVVLGPDFSGIAPPDQVDAALAPAPAEGC